MQTLTLAAIALPIMFMIDMAWIARTGDLYRMQLGSLLRVEVLWPAAFAFYMIYSLALSYFVILPSVRLKSLHHALIASALFGLAAYATYDLTNMATILLWPLPLVVVDMLWGIILTAVTSTCVYLIALRILKY